jgi:hypothetical protein
MAQLIFKDSGLLIHQGRSTTEYENDPEFDIEIHEAVDVTGVFEDDIFFYFPTLNTFLKSNNKGHAIARAIKQIIDPGRIDALIDALEDNGSFHAYLNSFNIQMIRRKINKSQFRNEMTS